MTADCFIVTLPYLADDELDPHQLRLLVHYMRRANHTNVIEEGLRATATACQMSVNKVRAALPELAALGYLTFTTPTYEEQRRGDVTRVMLIDRTEDNEARYAEPVSKMTQPAVEPVSELTQDNEEATQPVLKVTQADAEPVSDLIQPADGAVSNLTPFESLNTKTTTNTNTHTARAHESSDFMPDGSPLPYHIANGLGMTGQPPRYGERADEARRHPLVQAFMGALPEGARPPVTAHYLDIAERLAADGFTPAHVAGLTTEKVAGGKVRYSFTFLESDLPAYRYAQEHPTAPRPVTQSRASPPAPPRPDPYRSTVPYDPNGPDFITEMVKAGKLGGRPANLRGSVIVPPPPKRPTS